MLTDAVRLNQALLKRPFTNDRLPVSLRYNVWDCYRRSCAGEEVLVTAQPTRLSVDRMRHSWSSWDDYCRDVIWYGNKKGAYLYEHQTVDGLTRTDGLDVQLGMTPTSVTGTHAGTESQIAGIY